MQTLTIAIQTAQYADIPAIRTFAEEVYVSQYPDERQRRRFLDRVYSESSLKRSIDNSGAHLVIAKDAERVVGVIHYGSPLLEECEERKEVHRLLVHADYTLTEVGSALLQAMTDHYQNDETVEKFFVFVPSSDEARQAFYRTHQFEHYEPLDKDSELYYIKTL
jgi:ribosomal protein S18 acetylase RimI-like enzyme